MQMMLLKSRSLGKILCLLYLGVLCVALLAPLPKSEGPGLVDITIRTSLDFDFLTHLVALSIWGGLLTTWRFEIPTLLLIAVSIAILLEVAQGITYHRTFEITDLVANITGVTLGLKAGFRSRINVS
jgi:VanZ family protein|tara:strand:- start:140 stop:520 length:381 start_codon:yes stop_codon:yes gene_type:complete